MSRRDDVTARLWRARADLGRRIGRCGDASAALDVFGDADRSRPSEWARATSTGFDHYRSAFRPAAASAAVICVSQRPWLFADAVANVERQVDLDIDVVFVTNHPGFADIDLPRLLVGLPTATVIDLPVTVTLGACLNAGLAATEERFVAKFDDDDWYGAHYLADALRAHRYAGAGVVGKHSYYADVGDPPARYLRFPGHEFSYTSTLAGGTLVIDRERVGDLAFDDVSIGEDRQFIQSCHRRGVSTFSADRFGFVQRRTGDNTWAVPDVQFLVGCVAADPADPVHVVDR